jgi:hypothetical protein
MHSFLSRAMKRLLQRPCHRKTQVFPAAERLATLLVSGKLTAGVLLQDEFKAGSVPPGLS